MSSSKTGWLNQITAPVPATEQQAYAAGFDREMHGASPENCHFRFFACRALTTEWERGCLDAQRQKDGQ